MSRTENHRETIEHIYAMMDTFEMDKIRVPSSAIHKMYFVEGAEERVARQLGRVFWLPEERAYTIFLYGYCALFSIPEFTSEALRRQSDRFTRKKLPHTIRTTAGFILDAFGYDRRLNRTREVIYRPSPVIRNAHGKRGAKARISNTAMAYFGYNLIRAAEQLSPYQDHPDYKTWQQQHYDYFGSFFRHAGYPFPHDRARAEAFAQTVDTQIANDAYARYWCNSLYIADNVGIPVTCKDLRTFLLPRSSRLFTKATTSICRDMKRKSGKQ